MKLNVMQTIQKFKDTGKINPRYGLAVSQIQEIVMKSDGLFSTVSNSFAFGYAQGYKAKAAEQKKEVNI